MLFNKTIISYFPCPPGECVCPFVQIDKDHKSKCLGTYNIVTPFLGVAAVVRVGEM